MLAVQFSGINSRQTIDIYCNGRRSIGHLAVGETLDTTSSAEKMADRFIVKEILGELLFSRLQLKLLL